MCSCFLRGFIHDPIEYEWFLDSSIWLIDGTTTGISTSSQSGPWSNDNAGVLHNFYIKTFKYEHPMNAIP